MFPFSNFRMDNIHRASRRLPPGSIPPADSQYDIFNEFLTKIAPLIHGRLADENRSRIQMERERMNPSISGGPRVSQIGGEMIDLTKNSAASTGPMNVNYAGLTEFQRAQLDLENRKLALQGQRLDEEDKLALQNENRLAEIAARAAEQSKQIGQRGDITSRQIEERHMNTMELADEKNKLTERLANLRGNQTMQAIQEQGLIRERLARIQGEEARRTQAERPIADKADRPPTASLIKTNAQVKYNTVINQHPEWRQYIKLNSDTGLPEVADVGSGWGKNDLTKETRDQIVKALGIGEESKKEETKSSETTEEPPKGAPKGGKWVTLPSGRRVYQPPKG